MKRKLIALICVLTLLVSFESAFAIGDGYNDVYTYNYDYWLDIRESPDAYKIKTELYSAQLGLTTPLKSPKSLFVRDTELYVCDTGNNRIIQLIRDENGFSPVRTIDSFTGAENNTFNTPNDVFVDVERNIYVADTYNNRVVMLDKDLNYLCHYEKPSDPTFDQKLSFLPLKITVDVSGRVYVLADNIFNGIVKFEADGTFSGFIGANKVSYDMIEYIWKAYIMSDVQRSQSESFVPTEYENICIDDAGFIYATNTTFSEYDLKYDAANPIRRLNGVGNDILIKNDRYPPIGDLFWVEGSQVNGPSKLIDITVLENDIYVAFDQTRGRIFGYDSQGVMLWAFGNKGNDVGSFTSPSAIEHMGRDLICLDQLQCSITVFTPTEYGNLIYDAIAQYSKGNYDESADTWNEVLRYNANYNMAFRGIGRALLRQNRYKEAMDYFEMAHDRENYGRAFKLYRKEWVERNIVYVAIALLALVVVWLGLRAKKRMKMEVADYERSRVKK